jgi:hypothetical protein
MPMKQLILLAALAAVACSAKTVTVAPSSQAPAIPTSPSTYSPTTFIVTYEVESTTGPGLPEKPAKITYYASNGFLKTITVKIGGYWSLNVEIPDGGSVQLHVQEDVFTSVDCDIDAAGLLNPIKGKTDLNGNGWTCDVPSHTHSSRETKRPPAGAGGSLVVTAGAVDV